MPKILNDMLDDNYGTYTAFAEAVGTIKLVKLKNAREKSNTIEQLKDAVNSLQNNRATSTWGTLQTARPYAMAATPSPPPARRFTTPQTPTQATPLPPGLQTPLARLNPYCNTPQTHSASPFNRDAPINPRNNMVIDMGPFPDTTEGWLQHARTVTSWNAKWGETVFPVLDRPYPLSPGMSPVGSWECFKCGRHTEPPHTSNDGACTHQAINNVERSYRARFRFGLTDTGPRTPQTPSPAPRTTAPVHQIETIEEVQEYYDTYENQGNVEEPSS
ncbi:hypothetical protein M422DRAFT_49262 [Sphaerobolus stellatus SS14]|uniref:Uncharacterized protein n=1 Tax=Sphaerobolus stellatus (strain SS14) TaxID=990650 RepID=A0A0C9VQ69_SPHS4|nr:hypothetical protein M422DRAFT_49262 [Sphaerobolus stellatus SS14]